MASTATDHGTQSPQAEIDSQARTHALQLSLSEIEGQAVTIENTVKLDIGVNRIDTSSGTKWVVRDFSPATPLSAIEQTSEILSFLSDRGFPSERTCGASSTTVIGGRPILITQFIPGQRPKPDKDTTRELGRLLGLLHTLPYGQTPDPKEGGAWHHVTPVGGILEEITASKSLLRRVPTTEDKSERIAIESLLQILDSFQVLSPLPEALVHPDFVAANAIETENGKLNIVDWIGSGLGPRIIPLGFLLMTVSFRSIRLVDVVLHAYKKHVELEKTEIDLLPTASVARWLVIGCWEVSVGRKTAEQLLEEHNGRTLQAQAILERAHAILR